MGYLYMLKCCDGSYYTGSTKNLKLRLWQHQNGEGVNFTRKRLPVELIYFEEYPRIDTAFYREKQVQNWSRKKKEALISGTLSELPALSKKVFRRRSHSAGGLDTIPSESLDRRQLCAGEPGLKYQMPKSRTNTGRRPSRDEISYRGQATVESNGKGKK
jgi:putative endonuclease